MQLYVPVAGDNEAWRFIRALTLWCVTDTGANSTTGSSAITSTTSPGELGLVLGLHTWCWVFNIVLPWMEVMVTCKSSHSREKKQRGEGGRLHG